MPCAIIFLGRAIGPEPELVTVGCPLLSRAFYFHFHWQLINVAFNATEAPDRLTALNGTVELMRIAPDREWHLVEATY